MLAALEIGISDSINNIENASKSKVNLLPGLAQGTEVKV
jgi:hypothetical protein